MGRTQSIRLVNRVIEAQSDQILRCFGSAIPGMHSSLPHHSFRMIHSATALSSTTETDPTSWEATLDQVAGVSERTGQYSAAAPVSPALVKIYEEVANIDESTLRKQLQQLDNDGKHAQSRKGKDDKTAVDPALLAEAIDFYLAASQGGRYDEEAHDDLDKGFLHAASALIKEMQGEATTRVLNAAPPGRLPWEVIDVDESIGAIHWACDLTEGRAQNPWRNGKLSDEAKTLMHSLHVQDPLKYSAERLAKMFRIRQQRAMAIIALKSLEAQSSPSSSKKPKQNGEEDIDLQKHLDTNVHFCHEAVGADERHYAILPSYPNYKELEIDAVCKRVERILGKPVSEIYKEDLTPELAKQALGIPDIGAEEERIAAEEERHMVTEFKRNLEYNLDKIGRSISRKNRKVHTPSRPEEGWTVVVTPLGRSEEEAYAARPDGSRRQLTEDEALFKSRQTSLPRRKVS